MQAEINFHEMEKCNENNFGIYKKYFEGVKELDRYFCIKNESFVIDLYGTQGSVYKSWSFLFNKCANDTSNCRSDMNKLLENVDVEISFLDNYIDHEIVENPYNSYLRTDLISVSNSLHKKINYLMKQIIYNSDIGYVFDGLKRDEFYHFSEPLETFDIRRYDAIPGNFMNVNYVIDNKNQIYFRSYLKLQDFLAIMAGLIQLVSQFSSIFINLINLNSFFLDVCKLYFEKDENMNSHPNISMDHINIKGSSQSFSTSFKPLLVKVSFLFIFRKPIFIRSIQLIELYT
jgi:hypothetical protein